MHLYWADFLQLQGTMFSIVGNPDQYHPVNYESYNKRLDSLIRHWRKYGRSNQTHYGRI